MQHNTPLSTHFKDKHIWFDIAVLAAFFVIAHYFPILKIVPLVGSLELFSFFCFHLLAKRSRFQLQGFLGGFISSTAVFLQTLNESKFSSTNERELMLTLLFAICAMLLECLFIIFFLSDNTPYVYYLPFAVQLACIVLAIGYINTSSRFDKQAPSFTPADIELLNDHPIIWKNVAKLSLLILALVAAMNFIGNDLGLSKGLSTFAISLFEAHAILASVMTQWSMQSQSSDLMPLLFLILLGSTISKTFLAYKGPNLPKKRFFITIMLTSLGASVVITLIAQYTYELLF